MSISRYRSRLFYFHTVVPRAFVPRFVVPGAICSRYKNPSPGQKNLGTKNAPGTKKGPVRKLKLPVHAPSDARYRYRYNRKGRPERFVYFNIFVHKMNSM